MVAQAPPLLVPAATMPVTPEIWRVLRYNDKMPDTNLDDTVTTGTHVRLACLIRLDGVHGVVVELVQKTSKVARGVLGRWRHDKEGRRESGTLRVPWELLRNSSVSGRERCAFLGSYFVTPA
jgi:hypothetical protein